MAWPVGMSGWLLPAVERAGADGPAGVGADLEPVTLLGAYARGIFLRPIPELGAGGWCSSDPLGVLPLDGFRVWRSLCRFRTTIDTAFADVISGCADPA